ncbi:MAG: hypothetical protein DWQ02_01355 [Bacteroidetes bacterium]|nr:MAG: hypothetical protein DWQ02_01355 [Bacteroidota bacterium]
MIEENSLEMTDLQKFLALKDSNYKYKMVNMVHPHNHWNADPGLNLEDILLQKSDKLFPKRLHHHRRKEQARAQAYK